MLVAGDTGSGKSTLAAQAAADGCGVISDDAVIVRWRAGVPVTWFGERLSRPRQPAGAIGARLEIPLADGSDDPLPIVGVVVLGARAGGPFVPAGAATIPVLHQHCFTAGADTIRRNLADIVRLTSAVPVIVGSVANDLAQLSAEWQRAMDALHRIR